MSILSLRDTATKRSQLNIIMMTRRVEIAELKVFIAVNNNNVNNDEVEGIPSLKTVTDRCVTKITQVPKLEVKIWRSQPTMGQ